MRVLFIASEVAPWSKTGGLADVASALPRALAARGHEVLVVSPRYALIDPAAARLERRTASVAVRFPHGEERGGLFTRDERGVRWAFLDHEGFFDRAGVYGDAEGDYPDNDLRFAFLSVGGLVAARELGFLPDVVHAHDWQTGLVPLALRRGWAGADPLFAAPTVFTIHNLAYQGRFPPGAMERLGLPADVFSPTGLEFWDDVSLLKSGLAFSEQLTTVSPRYAVEIRSGPEQGAGFEGLLAHRGHSLHGILNGADYEHWSPETDPALAAPYSADHLGGKARCKAALLAELGLEGDSRPLIGVVGRLAHQKGVDLVAEAMPRLVDLGVSVALVGSGDAALERTFRELARRFAGRLGVRLGFDDALAHRVQAGADLFLMPSRFEPCGLAQRYALRYGAPPVVRGVGGLRDTVIDADADPERGVGFVFEEATADALVAATARALAARGEPRWSAIVQRGMALDFSWDRAAAAYERVYAQARGVNEGASGIKR